MTEYGKQTAYDFGYDLAAGGAIVVSGMALGVDGMAMAARSAPAVSPWRSSAAELTFVNPKAHRTLMKEVARTGVVITGVPSGFSAGR